MDSVWNKRQPNPYSWTAGTSSGPRRHTDGAIDGTVRMTSLLRLTQSVASASLNVFDGRITADAFSGSGR